MITSIGKATAITVGTFDGVHKGHKKVIEFLKSESERRGLRPVVITFDPHPLVVVAPERAPKLLENPGERAEKLRELGVEVIVLRFDEELRRLSAAEWLQMMHDRFGAEMVVAGFDNTFGCDGICMGIGDYRRLGESLGLEILEAPIEKGVSSSMIRRALGAGEVAEATKMLGRPFSVSGEVIHGRELGRQLGYPTANLRSDSRLLLPAPGVYAADAELPDGSRHRAVVNIGVAPTVEAGLPLTVEAYIPRFCGNLYGSTLRIEFLRRLRDEKRFASLDELKSQIETDSKAAMGI